MGAKANRTYVAAVKETAWGVTPGTPTMQKVNFTGESLNYAIETAIPETIRDDRQVSDLIQQSAGNEGGYEFEMQFGGFGPDPDQFLVAALWTPDWLGPDSPDLNGGVLTATTKNLNLTGTAGTDHGLVVGQKIRIQGSANDNDGIYTIAAVNGVDDYTLNETVTADETFGAGVTMDGKYIRNGVFRHSFTIERGHDDVTQFFTYTGMVVNEFSLAIAAGEIVTGSFSFVGKDSQLVQAPIGSSYIDQAVTDFMSANFNVRAVSIDGVPIADCLLQSLELNINNNVEGRQAVGQEGYCNTSEGEFEATGSVVMYFNDETMYSKFRGNTPFSLSLDLYDNAGNEYNLYLPELKLSADPINAESKNSDVLENAEYAAIIDPEIACMIQITRFPAS